MHNIQEWTVEGVSLKENLSSLYGMCPVCHNSQQKNQALGSTAVAQCKWHWGTYPSPLPQDQSKEIKELQTNPSSHLRSYSTNSLCPKRVGWLGLFVPSHHNDSAGQAQASAGLGRPARSLWPRCWEGLSPAGPDRSSGLGPAGCQTTIPLVGALSQSFRVTYTFCGIFRSTSHLNQQEISIFECLCKRLSL